MGRRLVLLGFVGIIEPGSVWQIVVAMTFSLLYTVIQLQAAPYKDESDGYLAVCVSVRVTLSLCGSLISYHPIITLSPKCTQSNQACITGCLMCIMVFKFNNLTELQAIREKMSYKQLLSYDPHTHIQTYHDLP